MCFTVRSPAKQTRVSSRVVSKEGLPCNRFIMSALKQLLELGLDAASLMSELSYISDVLSGRGYEKPISYIWGRETFLL